MNLGSGSTWLKNCRASRCSHLRRQLGAGSGSLARSVASHRVVRDQRRAYRRLALAQTSDGWLWLGGSAGLYRFDGVVFERVEDNANDPGGARAISAFFGSVGGPSYRLCPRRRKYPARRAFHALRCERRPPSATIYSFAQDADGAIAATRSGLMSLDGARWRRIGDDAELPDGYASDVFSERGGALLVAINDQILRRAPGSRTFQRAATTLGQASFIQSLDGLVWYLDDAGLTPFLKKKERRGARH